MLLMLMLPCLAGMLAPLRQARQAAHGTMRYGTVLGDSPGKQAWVVGSVLGPCQA